MSNKNENTEGKLLDHNYDDIQELDNPLPTWWVVSFYLSIVFSVFYFIWFHMMEGHSLKAEHHTEMSAIKQTKAAQAPGAADDEAALNSAYADKTKLENGAAVYALRCLPCHGPNGQGTIGPNLTDKFWIHGDGKMPAIAKTIREGILDKGMPAWGPVISNDELINVTAYIRTLQGTNPPNPKAPQGNEIKE